MTYGSTGGDSKLVVFFVAAGTRGSLDRLGLKRYSGALPNTKITNNFTSPKVQASIASGDIVGFQPSVG